MRCIAALLALFYSSFSVCAIEQFVRYQLDGTESYGKLVEDTIVPIQGDLFGDYVESDVAIRTESVEFLLPTKPEKVFAVGMNFASHAASPSDLPPPLFLKLPSSLILSGEPVEVPKGASNVHFEGELVVVIGKKIHKVDQEQAKAAIFGITVGNDITERGWQSADLQWLRAKASDGFGPIGHTITRGVDYNNVELTTLVNGKVVQQENTAFMIHSPAKVVSYISHYFTLRPGDLVFMGTPGRTFGLKNEDQVTVSIKGVESITNQIRF